MFADVDVDFEASFIYFGLLFFRKNPHVSETKN